MISSFINANINLRIIADEYALIIEIAVVTTAFFAFDKTAIGLVVVFVKKCN